MKNTKTWKDFWKEEDGMGTVEIILIIVVLIGLVMIFREEIMNIVEGVMKRIGNGANQITFR